jgi:hypothetical protein
MECIGIRDCSSPRCPFATSRTVARPQRIRRFSPTPPFARGDGRLDAAIDARADALLAATGSDAVADVDAAIATCDPRVGFAAAAGLTVAHGLWVSTSGSPA